jgi:hypothetical protein
MKPQVETIFTFDNLPQQMASAIATVEQFDNKQEFFRLITGCLTDEEKETLVKVSCQVEGVSIPSPKHWYLECKGKFWDDEIPERIKEGWNIESKIIPVN